MAVCNWYVQHACTRAFTVSTMDCKLQSSVNEQDDLICYAGLVLNL